MATDPALAQLGAQVFQAAGHTYIAGSNPLTEQNAASTLDVNTGLAAPYLLTKDSLEPSIYCINWSLAPLLALLQAHPMKRKTIPFWTNRHQWTTDRHMPEMTEATGSTPVGGTTLTVSFSDMFMVDDVVSVPDAGDAQGQVTDTATGSITVSWFTGCAPTIGIGVGTPIYKLNNTKPEFYVPTPSPTTSKIQEYNYFCESSYARQESDRYKKAGWQIQGDGSAIPAYEKEKLYRGAQLELEKIHWFGRRSWNAGAGGAGGGRGMLNGVLYAPGARRVDMGTETLTPALLNDFIDRGRRHRLDQPGQVYIFLGTSLAKTISTFGDSAVRITPQTTEFGVTINKWNATDMKGQVGFIVNPLFDFMARDDLMVMVRMDPECVAYLANGLYPNFTYQEHVIPFGASYSQYGWKICSSQMIKDGFGHVNIAYNLGVDNSVLI